MGLAFLSLPIFCHIDNVACLFMIGDMDNPLDSRAYAWI